MPGTPEIVPPGAEKFIPPPVPAFGLGPAVLSAISLMAFAAASVAAAAWLGGQGRWWTLAPFVVTAVGSGGGFLYEGWLILRGRPFALFGSPSGRAVQALRAGNLALVFGSVYLLMALFGTGGTPAADVLVVVVGAATGFLLVALLFRGPPWVVAGVLTAGLAGQVVVLFLEVCGFAPAARWWLLAAAVGLYATALVGADTPLRSTVFHLLGAAVAGALALGVAGQVAAAPPAEVSAWGTALRLGVAAAVAGFAAFRLLPGTWAVFRSGAANSVWPLFYLVVAGGMRIPRPRRLSRVYAGRERELTPLRLLPYYMAHPRNLTHPVCIPCLDDALTVKVHSLGFLGTLVRFVFALASAVGRVFPFAQVRTPLAVKPRMEPWSDGTAYWPRWLTRTIWLPRLGRFSIQSGVRGPGFQPTPPAAVERYDHGQLLAYLAEYGAAEAFLRPVTFADGRGGFELDLSFLEHYESKPDYERYGGRAFFVIDPAAKRLRLTHLRGPRSELDIPADPTAPTFRHVEDIVLASLYFYVVSGKHLVEIHMGLNLVEVALFNSFDARGRFRHPVRLALYPHLFAHELAEELTTQNLLEDGAVFSQIFATTGASLMRHLNDRFSEYQLGVDEDFERREAVLLSGRPPGAPPDAPLEVVLPDCGLVWEKRYAAVWRRYATRLVHAAFADDPAVAADACVHTLASQLRAVFVRPLPDRYAGLATRDGLARLIADLIHHLVVRHEVYGTTAVRLALDPRISKVQVPKDGGPYAVDEWRSLACIATATSRVRYVLFVSEDWSDVFDDLEDDQVRAEYRAAHRQLIEELRGLEAEWTAEERNGGRNNYDTLRVLPSELDLGAGY